MTTVKTANYSQKTFLSLKNQTEFSYQTDAERLMMALLEFDLTIDSYNQFEFHLFSVQRPGQPEASPGYIVEREGAKEFVIINDRLAANENWSNYVKRQMQRKEPRPITLTVRRSDEIKSSILAQNISFLYELAVQPPPAYEDCVALKNIFSFVSAASFLQLKKLLGDGRTIYYLLFYRGLRADLSAHPLNDNTEITLGPLIDSILKNITSEGGESNNVYTS